MPGEREVTPPTSTVTRLPQATIDALHAYAARATWPAGFVIYQRGTPADGVFVVLEGRVILRSRVRAGRGFIPWIATAGETFGGEGLSASPRYSTEARADDAAATIYLSAARFRALLREQPQHACALMAQMLSERSSFLEKLRELTTMSVEQRLVGATRESVSLVLGRFAAEGLIERKGSSFIIQPGRLLLRTEELPLEDLLA